MSYDYTTFTEVDVPADRISSTAATLSVTNLDTDEEVYSYLDLGAGYFDGDYEFQFQFNVSTADSHSYCYLWGLANAVDDLYATTITNDLDGHVAYLYVLAGMCFLAVREYNGGAVGGKDFLISASTDYYVTIARDESVGTYGTITLSVYSDSARTTHISGSPQTLTLTEKADFRYLYGMSAWNSGAGGVAMSVDISDLTFISRKTTSASVGAIVEYPYYEMWDYLTAVTPDSEFTLDLKPNNTLVESGEKPSVIHYGDDGSEERISLDDDSVFYVTLQWDPTSEADSGTIVDFYHSTHKGNGTTNSFYWVNYGEPEDRRHTYVVRFASALPRTIRRGNLYGISNITLKVLGRA